jgi:hypothetical protein
LASKIFPKLYSYIRTNWCGSVDQVCIAEQMSWFSEKNLDLNTRGTWNLCCCNANIRTRDEVLQFSLLHLVSATLFQSDGQAANLELAIDQIRHHGHLNTWLLY